MCYWRRVRNVYKKCGHGVTLPDEEIRCDLVNCKFSPAHPKDCRPPQCLQTCWQYTHSNTRHTSINYVQVVLHGVSRDRRKGNRAPRNEADERQLSLR
ncbi:hypothetical protein FPV67DRAFT_423778 [Lyophyllum atratum]|nr:hypothetical protein FPV67DRAFT_423778 [Lyophyllum atratum]